MTIIALEKARQRLESLGPKQSVEERLSPSDGVIPGNIAWELLANASFLIAIERGNYRENLPLYRKLLGGVAGPIESR